MFQALEGVARQAEHHRRSGGTAMSDLLSTISRAGVRATLPATASAKERSDLLLRLGELRAAGHAVVADEDYNRGGAPSELRVMHYLTCRACRPKGEA